MVMLTNIPKWFFSSMRANVASLGWERDMRKRVPVSQTLTVLLTVVLSQILR